MAYPWHSVALRVTYSHRWIMKIYILSDSQGKGGCWMNTTLTITIRVCISLSWLQVIWEHFHVWNIIWYSVFHVRVGAQTFGGFVTNKILYESTQIIERTKKKQLLRFSSSFCGNMCALCLDGFFWYWENVFHHALRGLVQIATPTKIYARHKKIPTHNNLVLLHFSLHRNITYQIW